jgi:hypothetical protein
MSMNDRPAWFAPKRFGLGAGLPIAWQGWAILAGFVATLAVVGLAFKDRPAAAFAILLPVALALMIVVARTTRGGWRWRWGERD